ncbi:MAG: hypothetical protein NWE91_03255 [Candidatus Bathyarchaeota archaeon]|nr:hypothetical protein [Candidatus Bathyarchaeota archaeon]
MDKVEKGKEDRLTMRNLMPRVFKALLKVAIGYILFFVLSELLIPFKGIYSYQTGFTALIVLFLIFTFFIELAKGTIVQHVFSIANSLMIVFYFVCILDAGIINVTIEQVDLMVDLRFFLSIFILGGVLSFAKSMLQLVNWMNEKEERWLIYQIKSL